MAPPSQAAAPRKGFLTWGRIRRSTANCDSRHTRYQLHRTCGRVRSPNTKDCSRPERPLLWAWHRTLAPRLPLPNTLRCLRLAFMPNLGPNTSPLCLCLTNLFVLHGNIEPNHQHCARYYMVLHFLPTHQLKACD